ncbi:MAG: hypothetical protein JSS02_16160 [Planctomycetes bacterium]|nr:hypothetical protein [Planctomycetota bacterium]
MMGVGIAELIILGLCGAVVLVPAMVVIGYLVWKQLSKNNHQGSEENPS